MWDPQKRDLYSKSFHLRYTMIMFGEVLEIVFYDTKLSI